MTKLKCHLCGGALVMDETWDFAECEQCGMKYSKESIQRMLYTNQTVDTPKNSADTLLLKAEQLMIMGDYIHAKRTYQKVLDDIDPLSSNAWWGLLRCRFHFTDMLLSGQLDKNEITFLFDGKEKWDMSAFKDNLQNARIHASAEQKQAYEHEYAEFMEALPEKRRVSEAGKGEEQLNQDIEQLNQDIEQLTLVLSKLKALQAERKASLKDIKRKKKIRILWLALAILGTLSTLYITYCLLTNIRSFSALLFEFIVSLFIMVVFWMIFSFYKSGDLKKSRIAYLTSDAANLVNQINDAENRLNERMERRYKLEINK